VLGADTNGNISFWELRSDGLWSGGRLIARVKEVGRVHSADLLLYASVELGRAARNLVMLCGGDRACVFDLMTRSKSIVLFCALSLQVMVILIMKMMAMAMVMIIVWQIFCWKN
jgi:hypothetical protein